jgi:hypothetical protein
MARRRLTLRAEDAKALSLLMGPAADEFTVALDRCGWMIVPQPQFGGKRPTNPALAVHCRAWEVCSVIGKLVSTHDDGYGFGWPGASAEMDDL